jgi:anti-sigma factor RsiW
MTLITDEILMAYADDELEPDARRAVLDALTRDPGSVRLLDVFLATRISLARLFQAPMYDALPERFTSFLREDDDHANVCRPERGTWLDRLKFLVTVLAPAFSATIAIELGTGCALHRATVSTFNSLPSI